jgi:hypothetical protein
MRRKLALLIAIVLCGTAATVYALYEFSNEGTWPKTWPKELESLRMQSRTLIGPEAEQPHYEIPFTRREDFESAWPHLLKVKSKGAPLVLLRAPDSQLGFQIKAGARIHGATPCSKPMAEAPLEGSPDMNPRERWMYTTYIDLIVDGDVVDLNRIPLPADTPIIDQRFNKNGK